MSFEQLGVGGVLTFDEAPGIAGMRRASTGLATLENRFNTFKDRIRGLGAELEKFNLLGIGLASAGIFGFGGLVKEAFKAKSEVEDMQIVLASTLKMTNKNIKELGDFGNQAGTAMGIAAEQMQILEANAAVAPGETKDLLNIYKQILGPMSAAGQSLDQVQKATVGAAIASQALGIDFDNMGYGLQRLISGQIRSADMLYRSLHAQNLITESAQEWAALPVAKRLEKINALMDKYNESANLVGGTWSAMSGTVVSIAKLLARGFITPLFDDIKSRLGPLTQMFTKNGDTIRGWREAAEAAGQKLLPIFDFLAGVLGRVWKYAKAAWHWAEGLYARVSKLFSGGGFGETASKVAALGLSLSALGPVLSLVKLAAGPVISGFKLLWSLGGLVVGAIEGIGSVILGLSLPALLAIGGAAAVVAGTFYLFQEKGETLTDTLERLWDTVLKPFGKGFGEGFMKHWPAIVDEVSDSISNLREVIELLLFTVGVKIDGSKNDWKSYGESAGDAVGSFAETAASAVGVVLNAFNLVVFGLINVKYAFETASTAIATFFFNAAAGVVNLVKGLYNAVTAPLRAIVEMVADMLGKLGRTKLGRSLSGKFGFDPSEAAEDLRKMNVGNGALAASAYIDEAKYDFGKSPAEQFAEYKQQQIENMARSKQEKIELHNHVHVHQGDIALKVDGHEIAHAQTRAQIELSERAGASVTPWQRRAAVVRGKQLATR